MRDELTDDADDGETENASEEEGAEITFSGRKLSVKSAAFPFVRPPVFSSSLLALARLPVIRPSVSPLPSVNRSSVRRSRFPPGRNLRACTQSVAPSRSRRERGAGEKSLGAVRFSSEAADAPEETEPRL